MAGKMAEDLVAIRGWLREALSLRFRLEEAERRVRLLERIGERGHLGADEMRTAQEEVRLRADAWLRCWLDRVDAVDRIPDGGQAAVLGYRYLQGLRLADVAAQLDISYKTAQQWDEDGCRALVAMGWPKGTKNPPE